MIPSRIETRAICALAWSFSNLLFLALPMLAADQPPVAIALRAAAFSQGQIVLVRDIATVYTEDSELKERISLIDVADPLGAGESSRLTRSQISLRLMLAGFRAEDFHLGGADVVKVSYDSEVAMSDELVLGSVRGALSQRLELPAADIRLMLLRPIKLKEKYESLTLDDIRLETRLPSNLWTKLLSVGIGIHVRGRLHEIVTVALETQINFNAPRTLRDVNAGEIFTAANLGYQATQIAPDMIPRLAKNAIGKRATRDLRAGDIVEQKLVTTSNRVKQEILVRQREAVQVVARRGVLVVKTQEAVALDSGREGDQVRVQNRQTGRIVRGRVAKRWTVEIPF
jgi:flagella basal body P-ring formation protein FlgA